MPPPKKAKPLQEDYVCEHIATVLSGWTQSGGSQKDIADGSGLSTSMVSLVFRGLAYPSRDAFEELADQFDAKTRAALIEAYILDGLPLKYQEWVSVRVRPDDNDEPSLIREESGSDTEVEQYFVWLKRMVKTKREFRDWFLTNMRIFRRSDREG